MPRNTNGKVNIPPDFPVIYIDDVHRYYVVGDFVVKALDGVSMRVGRGDFTAIMGPSGSGKSTLMNLIGCLDTPTSGRILIDGEDTSGLNETELSTYGTARLALCSNSSISLPK